MQGWITNLAKRSTAQGPPGGIIKTTPNFLNCYPTSHFHDQLSATSLRSPVTRNLSSLPEVVKSQGNSLKFKKLQHPETRVGRSVKLSDVPSPLHCRVIEDQRIKRRESDIMTRNTVSGKHFTTPHPEL